MNRHQLAIKTKQVPVFPAASVSCAVDSTGSLLLDPDTSEEQVCQCATLVSFTVTLVL